MGMGEGEGEGQGGLMRVSEGVELMLKTRG